MRPSTFDRFEPAQPLTALPARFVQTSSLLRALATAGLVVPIFAALVLPFGLVAARAAGEPETLAVVAERPEAALQLALALFLGLALVAYPLRRVLRMLGRRRTIEIDATTVTVRDISRFGTRAWSRPLASYQGIAHHVRATLSGTRHEVVLVHPDPRRDVLIEIAERIPQSRIDALATLLGRPELPSRVLYGARVTG
jgi:hypothetical protein